MSSSVATEDLTFDISVDDALTMQIGQRNQCLAHDEHNILFFNLARFHLLADQYEQLVWHGERTDNGTNAST